VARRKPVHNDIRQGFAYERVPHITFKSIADNTLIDDIWQKCQAVLEPLRAAVNGALGKTYEEWQIPRDLAASAAPRPHNRTPNGGKRASPGRRRSTPISPRAPMSHISTTGPIPTAGASASPGRSGWRACRRAACGPASEEELVDVIDYLKKQEEKGERIGFESLTPLPGNFVGANGTFTEGENGPERRSRSSSARNMAPSAGRTLSRPRGRRWTTASTS
jgi:adenine-specific DNA-methyltransferase